MKIFVTGPLIGLASCFCLSSASAVTTCVTTGAQLTQALTTAGVNQLPDDLRLTSGTYSSAVAFNYGSAENSALTISGGWDATCTNQTSNAALTVLDGQNARRVLLMTMASSSTNVTIRNLTVQNGNSVAQAPNSNGGGLSVGGSAGYSGNIEIDSVIFANNTTGQFGGALLATSDLGSLTIRNSLAWGNLSQGTMSNFGAFVLTCNGSATNLVNNTIIGNASDASNSPVGGVRMAGSAPHTLTNNIIWANDTTDVVTQASSTTALSNDIGVLVGTLAAGSSGNVNVDPAFFSATDYRLRGDSTLIDKGNNEPNGGIDATDISGGPRVVGAHVDFGAFESTDRIFRNGLDN